MIKEKSFYKTYFTLVFSIALQNLLSFSVNFADNLMLGGYSEAALSSAAICNQIQFILQNAMSGIVEGIVVIGAQYWGKKDYKPIVDVIGIALRYGLCASLFMFTVVQLFPHQVLSLLCNDETILSEGVKYIRIVSFGYMIFMVTNLLSFSLRSIGKIRIGYIISATSLVINVCLNTCLIYGKFGMPELGVQGAAYATLTAQFVGLAIIIVYLKYFEKALNITLKKLIFIDKSFYKDFRKTAIPSIINGTQWGFAHAVQTAILGHLGASAVAANSISVTILQITTVIVYGCASAASIITGKMIGEGKIDKLKSLAKTIGTISLSNGILVAIFIWSIRNVLLGFYNISPETRVVAIQFLAVVAITEMGTALQLPLEVGMMRGGGDTKFGATMNMISLWLIVLPTSFLAAFVFKFPPVVAFACLRSEQVYKNIPVFIHLLKWNWVKNVTRDTQSA